VYNNDHDINGDNAKKKILTEQREILLVPSQVLATCLEMRLLDTQTSKVSKLVNTSQNLPLVTFFIIYANFLLAGSI